MKLRSLLSTLLIFFLAPAGGRAVGAPLPTVPLNGSPSAFPSPAVQAFNDLNSRVRDGRIGRDAARSELKRLLGELGEEYRRRGGGAYPRKTWVFPLAGHDARSIGPGRTRGYLARGYDYFQGNRHGGHPSFDIFIRDRNQDCRDDRSGRPVRVLSLTGGIVVALEREWPPGSGLRGGKYLWVYDPLKDLLVYYAHNAELLVGLGDLVRPGDPLASVGRSGLNAAKKRSPTHLHLTVLRVGNGVPRPLNVLAELTRSRTLAAE